MLVNTSFNIRGEPIVHDPADAYRCFMYTDMDALVVGNHLMRKERQPAMAGAEVLFYPTAIGWLDGEEKLHHEQYESWDTMLRSHAIANGVFVVAVNRTGREGRLRFWGASVVYAPNGQQLVKASHDTPETVVVECDLGRIEWSRTRWPFFRDRRIDAYGGLMARWGGA